MQNMSFSSYLRLIFHILFLSKKLDLAYFCYVLILQIASSKNQSYDESSNTKKRRQPEEGSSS